MLSQLRYVGGMQRVEEDILLTFYGTAAVSRTFLSFFDQLQDIIDLP